MQHQTGDQLSFERHASAPQGIGSVIELAGHVLQHDVGADDARRGCGRAQT
jgi:hypothetical protein